MNIGILMESTIMKNEIILHDDHISKLYMISYHRHKAKHRINGPAIIFNDSEMGWYQYGLIHRTDGPAMISATGSKFWYQNGERCRKDGTPVSKT
jgi:hypothetical protein